MAPSSASRHPFLESLSIVVMLTALLATSLWAMPRAYAAHEEGVFELEGNIADAVGTPGDDWESVYAGTSSADVSVFVDDGTDTPGGDIPLDTTYFQGGNTKDIDDISSWKYTDNSTPDKNEIEHAYAAAYQDEGDVLVYFGLDRYAVDGDAQVGFWFLQGQVGLNPDGTFSGSHVVGDILVLSDFTNGGAVNQIDIYEWVGTGGDTSGTLNLIDSATECDTEEQNGCAIVNTAPLSSPWAYDAKGEPGFDDALPIGAFFEGGINLTQLFNGEGLGCYTTFLAETRSSQEPTAVLKDFALGSFDLCSFEATLDADALGKITDPVTYTVTVTNTGQRELWLDSVTLSVSSDTYAIADADTNTCPDPLPAGASCELTFTRTVVEGDADPLGATVEVVMDETSTLDGVELTDGDDASTNLFQPSVDVTKTGTMTSLVGDEVAWTVTIDNTSSGDAPDLVFDSIVDTLAGDLMDTTNAGYEITSDTCGASLASGASCAITYDYTVQEGDPDPLSNTVEVHLHPEGFPNDITDSDSHDVDLFTLGLEIDKTGDALSKIGDPVTYTFTITNTSSDDAPDLLLSSLSDDRLGDLTTDDGYDTACDTLAPGDSCSFDVTVDVPETQDDPYVNVVTATYDVDGFETFDVEATDDHSLNLFQPSLTVDKDGPSAAQVGDEVTYSFTITNTSSDDAPNLVFGADGNVTDDVLGDLTDDATAAGCDDLASGESCSFDVAYTIQGGDADPLVNVVDVLMHPAGFPNDITGTDSHELEIFSSGLLVEKTGDALSKIGDPVTYTFTITNTSSADGPTLVLDTLTDDRLGDLTTYDGYDTVCDTLAPGDSCSFDVTVDVPETQDDPYVNVVTATYDWESDAEQSESDSAQHSLNLFQPSLTVDKDGPALAKVGDEVTYSFTITNTSSADAPNLVFGADGNVTDDVLGDLTDDATAAGCDDLASGESCSFDVAYTIQGGDADPLVNVVDVLMHPAGFPNDITDTDSHVTELFQPSVTIDKTGDALSKIGDPVTYTFTITNTSSVGTPDLVLGSLTDDRLGDLTTYDGYDTACDTLTDDEVCEFSITVDVPATEDDPYVNVVTVSYGLDDYGVAAEDQGTPTVGDSAQHSLNLFQPSLTVDKDGPALAKVGDEVTYSFTITNTSSADAPNLVFDEDGFVIDDVLGDLTAAATAAGCDDLASGESCGFDVAYTIQGGDADPLVNVVDVLMHPAGFPNDITGTDSHSTDLIGPNIALVKTVDPTVVVWDAEGTPPTVTYTYVVTNTGDVTLTDLVLDDDRLGPITLEDDTLAPGASTTGTADHTVTEAEADEGAIVNVAIVTGTAPDESTVSAVDDARVDIIEVLPSNPDIALVKTALIEPDDDGLKTVTYDADDASGNMVEYEYLITNTGDVTLTDITLVDDVLGDIVLPKTTLEPGESMTATATHLVTGADADEGQIVNVAEVTGFAEGGAVKATDDETVYVVEVLQLALTGIDADLAGMLALAMLALGGVLLLLGRKRPRPEDL